MLEAAAPDAAKKVLSIDEARSTSRLMFAKTGGKELILEFRSFSPDDAQGHPEQGQRECPANVVDNFGAAAIIGPVPGRGTVRGGAHGV